MVAQLDLIAVNLATVALESWLYGIFCVIFGTSIYLLVRRGREHSQGTGGSSRIARSVWKSPMFVASCLIAMSVTGVSFRCSCIPLDNRLTRIARQALDPDRVPPLRCLHPLYGRQGANHCVCGSIKNIRSCEDWLPHHHCAYIGCYDCEYSVSLCCRSWLMCPRFTDYILFGVTIR